MSDDDALIGLVFNHLTVIAMEKKNQHRYWVCICSCGNTTSTMAKYLRSGVTKSCGCLRNKKTKERRTTNGKSVSRLRSKEYRAWHHIKGRCGNPNDAHYASYGGRGIDMDPRWAADFSSFLSDMGRAPSAEHSVERKDNNKGYSKENCCWATRAEQARNTRRTVRIDGLCLKDACVTRGLSYGAVQARIRRGHPIELALSPLVGPAYRAMLAAAGEPE